MDFDIRKYGIVVCLCMMVSGILSQERPELSKEDISPDVDFSIEGGFYDHPVTLELFANETDKVFYTLDGTRPTWKSSRYRRPLQLNRTTSVRAVAYRGKKRSAIKGHTYFINEPISTIATVSIAITPKLLFDPEKGLFVKGEDAIDSLWTLPGANFWSRKETTANIEIFEKDGSCVYRSLSGFRLFGGMSRLFPQKSMAIVTRKRYGESRIRYPLFGKKGLKNFKFLVLRNSGSDWGKAHFRDALMTGLTEDWDIEQQDSRPSHLYINGQYWGIYNIREKINRYFIADHQKIDKDSIDLLEHKRVRKRGSRRHYLNMLSFLESHSLSDPSNYAYLQSLMDVENFMDYQIAQIYFNNRDAGGNTKYWRPQTPDGRWRWILFDTDWGFGLHNEEAYSYNSLAFHTTPDGPDWPNPPWSTFLLRKLLENEHFENEFINRFADHLNSTFQSKRVAEEVQRYYGLYFNEMPRHLKRWRLSEKRWKQHVKVMHEFARKRPDYMRTHLMEMFDTGNLAEIRVSAEGGGKIVVNDHTEVANADFQGVYFEKIPISLKAVPNFGYRLSHWEGMKLNNDVRELSLNVRSGCCDLKAVFEKYTHPLAGKIMINEIGPNNKNSGDWVEIYNHSHERILLENWIFTDARHEFYFPSVTINPNDYVVVCEEIAKFRKVFPETYNVVGDLGFGINKQSEILGLFDSDGAAVDSVSYNIPPTDSIFTLNLLLPHLENSDIENWSIQTGSGTPNMANPYFVESSIRGEQEKWLRLGIMVGIFFLSILLLHLRQKKIL
ncbi:MAG: hypothetical protein GY705_12505 [Bacteroidetes bacterium]|nr:hypothetical protein [Bacteroidota bacterium]